LNSITYFKNIGSHISICVAICGESTVLGSIQIMNDNSLSQVKHTILVSSGKGGVGKSTVAANLAAALSMAGHQTGLLDADISGPSQAVMWGLPLNAPVSVGDNPHLSLPFVRHGVKIASLATRMAQNHAVAWRGPMLSMAVINLLCHTDWGKLDYLVVDMPPGTGDIQSSICDKLPNSGVITVTTPQQVAVADARRGIQLYADHKLSLLGIIENMATHVCENCAHVNHPFGQHGAQQLSKEFAMPVLASVPLHADLLVHSDQGKPLVVADLNHAVSALYAGVVKQIEGIMHD
jgi:ATP-binding protein involved in chromosome partitioning